MTALRISCSLPPSRHAPAYARLAEELGCHGFSPSLHSEIWTHVGRGAEATSRITIGPGISVPSLRNPIVTPAIVPLADRAWLTDRGERSARVFGSGRTKEEVGS